MASKKGKKIKGKALSLQEFLGDSSQSNSGSAAVVVAPKSNWAEESEDYEEDRFTPSERIVLPTAPRQALGPTYDPEKVPKTAPFIAYVANLPFEVEDEDIEFFFGDAKISKIRLPRDGGETGRFKGFGYVEFETRADLLEALSKNNETMRNRQIHVDLAEEDQSRNRSDGFRRGDRGDRDMDRGDRSGGVSDWRAAPSEPRETDNKDGSDRSPGRRDNDRFGGRDRGGGGDRDRDRGFGDRDRDRDRGFGDRDRNRGFGDRDRDRGFGGDRDRDRGFGGDRDRDRGFGGDRDRDRGFGGDRDRDRGFGGDRDRDRGFGGDRDRDRGFGGDRDRDRGFGDRGGDRDRFGDRGDRNNDRRDGGRYDDRRGDRDGYRRSNRDDDKFGGGNRDKDREDTGSATKERPKLNLKPRTKLAEEGEKVTREEYKPSANPSIFGGAKPVDTLRREQEIEQKLKKEPERITAPARREVNDVFGAARPVDTAAREREIEEKLKKQSGGKDLEELRRGPLRLDKRSSGPKTVGEKNQANVEHSGNRPPKDSQEDRKEPPSTKEVKDETNEEHKKDENRKPKIKKNKDENVLLDTRNKFAELGLGEEEV